MTSFTVSDVIDWLGELAPLKLAEEWDNVGLLVGDRGRTIRRVMTCLTVTRATAAEAIEGRADLIVTHHPLPFRPLAQLTTDATTGRLLWDLIGAQIAVYSAHTAFDSARTGINQQLAEALGLSEIAPLVPRAASTNHVDLGSGRCGNLPQATTLNAFVARVKSAIQLSTIDVVGNDSRTVFRVGIACGSGGSFLAAAHENRCDCLVTGEANFHATLEAENSDIGLILLGHFASESFAMERLANSLAAQFTDLDVWASVEERDPLRRA